MVGKMEQAINSGAQARKARQSANVNSRDLADEMRITQTYLLSREREQRRAYVGFWSEYMDALRSISGRRAQASTPPVKRGRKPNAATA